MKITRVQLFRYDLPLVRPLSLEDVTIESRPGFLLRLMSDGIDIGCGEAAPLPGFSTESIEQVESELRSTAGELKALDIPDGVERLDGQLARLLEPCHVSPSARFAVESALLGMIASHRRVTLASLLSAEAQTEIEVNGLITDIQNAASEARHLLDSGYHTIKMKVGRGALEDDITAVRRVSDVLGDSACLRLDANRAWSYDEACRVADAIRGVEIEYIEEPCRSLDDSARLSQERRLPVAFDETLSEIEPSVLGQYSGLAAIVLKPTLLGGFENCAARARTARDIGAKVVMSSSFESSVGLAALASFAAAYGSPETAMGLDTLRWLQSDVTAEPIAIHDGRILIEQAARAVENINLSMLTQVFDV